MSFVMAIAYIFMFLNSLKRLFCLSKHGQALEDEINKLNMDIMEDNVTDNQCHSQEILDISDYLCGTIPLRPGNSFDLNMASLTNGLMKSITFAIILLQFKVAERSD